MKTISAALKAHMAGALTTLATCCKIARQDGTNMFFTDHDEPLEIDGDTYQTSSGMLISALSSSSQLNVDNVNTQAFLDSDVITEADLMAGFYDYADVDIFIVNYEDLTQGKLYLVQGWTLGRVTVNDYSADVEVQGKMRHLQQRIVRLITSGCPYDLGDTDCNVDVETHYTDAGIVTSVTDRRRFIDTSFAHGSGFEDVYTGGLVTWLDPESSDAVGLNAGISMEVKLYEPITGEFELFEKMPFDINVNDEFEVTYGCPKTKDKCYTRFGNVKNYGGFPFVPGMMKMSETKQRPPEIS